MCLLEAGGRKINIDELNVAGACTERQWGRSVVIVAFDREGAPDVFGRQWEFKTHVVASFLIVDWN